MNAKAVSTLFVIAVGAGAVIYQRIAVDQATKAANAAASGEDDDDAPDDPSEALGDKLDPYIKCLNRYSRPVRSGRETWLRDFDPVAGPDPKQARETLYGPAALDDLKECRDGVARARAAAPSLPELERAGDAYVAALAELQPMTVKLRAYFERGDYKDDKLALAIELHPKLIAAWERYNAVAGPLDDQVDRLEDRLQVEQLAHIEKTEGKAFHWLHNRMLMEAKKLVRFTAGAKTPAEIADLAGLQQAVSAFDTAVSELLAHYKQHEEQIRKRTMAYSSTESAMKSYLKSAKEMMRARRDGVRIDSEHSEGHPRHVIDAYNDLIDRSNVTRF